MAARPTWKGYLKISLVNIPVRVFPATDAAATISFNQLHRECRTRIQQKRWCPTCQVEVPNSDLVKGYEFEKGQYVVLDEEDIAKVRPASTRVINVVQFADASAIDPCTSSGRTTWRPTARSPPRRSRSCVRAWRGRRPSASSRSTAASISSRFSRAKTAS